MALEHIYSCILKKVSGVDAAPVGSDTGLLSRDWYRLDRHSQRVRGSDLRFGELNQHTIGVGGRQAWERQCYECRSGQGNNVEEG